MSRTPRLIDTDEFVLISELLDGEEESTDLAISRARLAESPNPDHIDQLQARYDLICRAKKSIMAVNRIASTIDAARAEGYRQGVEDGRTLVYLEMASESLALARTYWSARISMRTHRTLTSMLKYNGLVCLAFRGARGIARAEIRQRLAEMEKSNGQ